MNCIKLFEERNYSVLTLNQAFNDDSGSWWWWINVIGTIVFGLIGLIGNLICFLVICRFSLSKHSFVIYLRLLSFFDFVTLLFELIETLNQLFIYLFSKSYLNFGYSIVCKCYDYLKHSIILLSCWTIVALTIDRFILVCHPWGQKYPNLSRRFCNCSCAKRIILILTFFSLLINVPHLIYKEWICRPTGFQYSAIYNEKLNSNQTIKLLNNEICSCRVSPFLKRNEIKFFIFWNIYIFHLLSYTLIPAIILITSNTAILKRLYAPREIVSNQNEYLRSKISGTLALVSLIFVSLYFPYAIVQMLSYFIIRNSKSHCNVNLILKFHILKRLSELLNIIALGINFCFYILAVKHYRSSAIQMLGLHHFQAFKNYLTIQPQNITNSTQNHFSTVKLLKITTSNKGYSTSAVSQYNNNTDYLSTAF